MTTQDPFSRRSTPVPAQQYNVGVASDITDNSEVDNKRIAQFIPHDASLDEGYNRMMEILHQQSIDDARAGIKPEPTLVREQAPVASPADSSTNPFKVVPATNQEAEPSNGKDTTKNPEDKPKKEIKDEDVLPLLDSILMRGYASETFDIRGNKFTLRTQFFWEEYAVRKLVEDQISSDTLRITADALFQRYALASCLQAFGGNYFPPVSQGSPEELTKSLQARVDFLDTLPTILVYYVNEKRGEFNDKVVYLSENFDRLIKAF